MRYSPVNLVGQDSTKSVYSTISSLLQSNESRSKERGIEFAFALGGGVFVPPRN